MRALRVGVLVTLIFTLGVARSHSESYWSSLPPISQLVPRGTNFNPRITNVIRIEDLVNAGAYALSYQINERRLNDQTEAAVKAVAGQVKKTLVEGGLPGVLAEARYVRLKTPVELLPLGPSSGPSNMSMELLGNKLAVIGAGERPLEVLALSLRFDDSLHDGPSENQEYAQEAGRAFWFKLDERGNLIAAEIDRESLYIAARDIISNDALQTQLKAAAFRFALTNMLAAAERDGRTQEARDSAARLLSERKSALAELEAIDKKLNDEMKKAEAANRDTDRFFIVAALAGLGVSALQAADTGDAKGGGAQESQKAGISDSVTISRRPGPSGSIRQIIRQRVEIEGKILKNDLDAGAFVRDGDQVKFLPKWIKP